MLSSEETSESTLATSGNDASPLRRRSGAGRIEDRSTRSSGDLPDIWGARWRSGTSGSRSTRRFCIVRVARSTRYRCPLNRKRTRRSCSAGAQDITTEITSGSDKSSFMQVLSLRQICRSDTAELLFGLEGQVRQSLLYSPRFSGHLLRARRWTMLGDSESSGVPVSEPVFEVCVPSGGGTHGG